MRYMLLIYSAESQDNALSEAEMGQLMADYGAFGADLEAKEAGRGADRLRPVDMATTVKVRGGKATVTDGPFAETKEQLGGYYIVEAKNIDEAIEWAKKIPSAKHGSVEVRPIWEMEEPQS